MKMSVKLFWLFLLILLVLLIFQIIFSNHLLKNETMLRGNISSPADFIDVSTYKRIDCHSFSEIHIKNVKVSIIKSDEFAVFYNKYRIDTKIIQQEQVLYLSSDRITVNWENQVYIFMPEDPSIIRWNGGYYGDLVMQGFAGENTTCFFNNGSMNFLTNMHTVNVVLDSARLNLELVDNQISVDEVPVSLTQEEVLPEHDSIYSQARKLKREITNVFVEARHRSNIEIRGNERSLINFKLHLDEGSFYIYNSYQLLKNIDITGVLDDEYNSIQMYSASDTLYCDSLVIDVSGNSSKSYTIELPSQIKARYKSIKKTENISITHYQ